MNGTIKVTGGNPLNGTITPSGNKNAALPMLWSTLLTQEEVTIENIPDLIDVSKAVETLKSLGAKVEWDKEAKTVIVDSSNVHPDNFKGKLPLGIRSSLTLVAPMLTRFKEIEIDTNIGGCVLGMREIDPHIAMLEKLGAKVTRDGSKVKLELTENNEDVSIWPDYSSVTATENLIMAAVLRPGKTLLTNAASEPHVQDLSKMLISMGADIKGFGSNRIEINGVKKLSGTKCRVSSDHHEITTFLALGAMTGGEVKVTDAIPEQFGLIVNEFAKLGVKIEYEGDTAIVRKNQSFIPEKPFTENFIPRIQADPWPYFPADLLPLMIALSQKTRGPIRFWNKVYEGGLYWATELIGFGTTIEIQDPHRLIVFGPTDLRGTNVKCPYIIRAAVALVMTAVAAKGESILENTEPIFRGHPDFYKNLVKLGGKIEEIA